MSNFERKLKGYTIMCFDRGKNGYLFDVHRPHGAFLKTLYDWTEVEEFIDNDIKSREADNE